MEISRRHLFGNRIPLRSISPKSFLARPRPTVHCANVFAVKSRSDVGDWRLKAGAALEGLGPCNKNLECQDSSSGESNSALALSGRKLVKPSMSNNMKRRLWT